MKEEHDDDWFSQGMTDFTQKCLEDCKLEKKNLKDFSNLKMCTLLFNLSTKYSGRNV